MEDSGSHIDRVIDNLFPSDMPEKSGLRNRKSEKKVKFHPESAEKETKSADNSTLEQEFICPICRELLFNPVSLRCQHTYCMGCVSNNIGNKCPLCNKHYYLPKNINKLIENVTKSLFPEKYNERSAAVMRDTEKTNMEKETREILRKELMDELRDHVYNDISNRTGNMGPYTGEIRERPDNTSRYIPLSGINYLNAGADSNIMHVSDSYGPTVPVQIANTNETGGFTGRNIPEKLDNFINSVLSTKFAKDFMKWIKKIGNELNVYHFVISCIKLLFITIMFNISVSIFLNIFDISGTFAEMIIAIMYVCELLFFAFAYFFIDKISYAIISAGVNMSFPLHPHMIN